MTRIARHEWDVSPARARDIQRELHERIITRVDLGPITHIADIDVGFEGHKRVTRAAVVVVRSRDRVRPLYVSSGHRFSMDTAVVWVLACLTRYRLPEPTRLGKL